MGASPSSSTGTGVRLRQAHLETSAERQEARVPRVGARARLAVTLPRGIGHDADPLARTPRPGQRGGEHVARTNVGGPGANAVERGLGATVVEAERVYPHAGLDLAPPHAVPAVAEKELPHHCGTPPRGDRARQILEIQSLFHPLLGG